jgi:hypothetical protein
LINMVIKGATRGAGDPDDRGVGRRGAVTEPAATHRQGGVAMSAALAAGLIGLAAMVGTFAALPLSSAAPSSPPAPDAQSTAALATLATVPVKGGAPRTGYDGSLFGESWTDDVTVADGRNGGDARNDIAPTLATSAQVVGNLS